MREVHQSGDHDAGKGGKNNAHTETGMGEWS
jgi:hypothetical protein